MAIENAVAPGVAARRRPTEQAERSVLSPLQRRRTGVRAALTSVQALVLIGLLIAGLGPLLFLLKSAISTTQDVITDPFGFFPSGEVHWENLTNAWQRIDLGGYLINSAIIAAGSALATLIVAVSGGYVMSVLKPWWAKFVEWIVLATVFVPSIVSLVPLYTTVTDLGLINSYWAVWLPPAASAFNVLIVKRFFDTLPDELFEAARLDGAGPLRTLFSIVLPLSRPILGVVALLALVQSWKDFLWPLLVLQDPGMQPISVALPKIASQNELSVTMAALFWAVIIPVALFLVFQKQFLAGVSATGGLKS